jgi:hypothetical protein
MNHLALNPGVLEVAAYRKDQPTLICGLGRSGTTALARCFAVSQNAHLVTTDTSAGSNLEVREMNEVLARGDADTLRRFRERTSLEYSPSFVFKNPLFEIHARTFPSLITQWEGANLILMVRDPLCVCLREDSIFGSSTNHRRLLDTLDMQQSSIRNVLSWADQVGVLMVSYEKLLIDPRRVVAGINHWTTFELLDPEGSAAAIVHDNPYYLRRQAIALARLQSAV